MGNVHQTAEALEKWDNHPFGVCTAQETDNLGPSLGQKKRRSFGEERGILEEERGILGEERGILNIQQLLQHQVNLNLQICHLSSTEGAEGCGYINFPKGVSWALSKQRAN